MEKRKKWKMMLECYPKRRDKQIDSWILYKRAKDMQNQAWISYERAKDIDSRDLIIYRTIYSFQFTAMPLFSSQQHQLFSPTNISFLRVLYHLTFSSDTFFYARNNTNMIIRESLSKVSVIIFIILSLWITISYPEGNYNQYILTHHKLKGLCIGN